MPMAKINIQLRNQTTHAQTPEKPKFDAMKFDQIGQGTGDRRIAFADNMNLVPESGLAIGQVHAIPFRSGEAGREEDMDNSQTLQLSRNA